MRIQTCLMAVVTFCMSQINTAYATVIDFEPPLFALGTVYGTTAGHVPGTVVFNVGNIEASVRNFYEGSYIGFNYALIAGHPGPPISYFPPAINPSQVLQFNNINMGFDFRGVSSDVTGVRFDYVDFGGTENFDLNMTGRQEIPRLSAITAPPGFTINVSEIPIGTGSNVWGTVSIIADPGNKIELLLIGGQEFAIDDLANRLANSADFDLDGDVDDDDFVKWEFGFGKNAAGDADNDGDTDGNDFLLWQTQYGSKAAVLGASQRVPEPSTAVLLLVGSTFLCMPRRVRKES